MSGVSAIETMMIADEDRVLLRAEQADRHRRAVEHEGELAALGHQHRALHRLGAARPAEPGDDVDADRLQHHEAGDAHRDEPEVRARPRARSSAMPTLRKKSPSRMPRNGSTSASSWWR